jgi:hypothetical protein
MYMTSITVKEISYRDVQLIFPKTSLLHVVLI